MMLLLQIPDIKDADSCINCKRCVSVCPIKNVSPDRTEVIECFAGSFKEDAKTISCASGGLATAISETIIKTGGVVYGTVYAGDYKSVVYKRIDQSMDLPELKGSKYAQSYKGNIYKRLSDDLKQGLTCLFVGLPCDVAAVVGVFGKYDNLYTVELVCHGPTSVLVQQQYCEWLEDKYSSAVESFSTRYKKDGKWIPFYVHAKMRNGAEFTEQFHHGAYGAAFRYLKRPSCNTCPMKEDALLGDVMIGDYHYVETGMKGYNPHGVSSAIVRSTKGQKLLEQLDSSFNLVSISKRNGLANGAIHKPIAAPEGTEEYVTEFRENGLISAYGLRLVKQSNFKREIKQKMMHVVVKVKRILIPSSRPKE